MIIWKLKYQTGCTKWENMSLQDWKDLQDLCKRSIKEYQNREVKRWTKILLQL